MTEANPFASASTLPEIAFGSKVVLLSNFLISLLKTLFIEDNVKTMLVKTVLKEKYYITQEFYSVFFLTAYRQCNGCSLAVHWPIFVDLTTSAQTKSVS
ncbi:hypothetical protein [Entomobacter blattae]|uniref:Uncharacterized protein n=1 Tax=Entomobacter blattae TaxID=2762277 RepID=A0A7H1NNY0_9PROT|nr:hypothetical protein [Entomobacter blattae]QNT77490.1 hypothetical protein JGUZn3_02320 [Entomobacter blattae]